jgi:hypothetical protein
VEEEMEEQEPPPPPSQLPCPTDRGAHLAAADPITLSTLAFLNATPALRTTPCTCNGTRIAYSSPPPSPTAVEPKYDQNWDPAGDD